MSDTDINPCPLHDTSVIVTNCNVLLDNNTDDLLLRADNHTGIRILRHIINEPGSKRNNIHPLMNDTKDGVDYTCYVYGWLHGSSDNTGGNNFNKITSFASESTHSMFNATKDVSHDIHEVHLKVEHTFDLCDFNGFPSDLYTATDYGIISTIRHVSATDKSIYTIDTDNGTTLYIICHYMIECESKDYADYLQILNGTNSESMPAVYTTSDNGETCDDVNSNSTDQFSL